MSVHVVLAVGPGLWQLTTENPVLKTAGFICIFAMSIRDAIEHFHAGGFDLVLLDDSIAVEQKERLTFFIQASGADTPVLSVARTLRDGKPRSDSTLNCDIPALLKDMTEALEMHEGRDALALETKSPKYRSVP